MSPSRRRLGAALLAGALTTGCAPAGQGPALAVSGPSALVVSESADLAYRVGFDGDSLRVLSRREIGTRPAEVDGPHGVAVLPGGREYLVTVAHGAPEGALWKIDAVTGRVLGSATLGRFPSTVDVTPDGAFAFVANSDFHGDHAASSVSKVDLRSMREVARTRTCAMPHGSRVDPGGLRHYSGCMMSDLLVEIDVASGRVSRRFSVAPAPESVVGASHQTPHGTTGAAVCSPTWAQPSVDGRAVYVACNRSGEVLEIDVRQWALRRRFATGAAPYNLATTPDGRLLLVTLKRRDAPGLAVVELTSGRIVRTLPAAGALPHGVAVTPDSRWAFLTSEGIASDPGRVELVDLAAMRTVAVLELGPQAGGVAVLPR